MAYGEHYYTTFCDRHENSYRVSIKENEYAGPAVMAKGGPAPAVLRYESFSDSKFDTIRASQLIVTLVSSQTFNSQNFYTGDEKKFRVELYKNGILVWVGYLMPKGIRENFKAVPNLIVLTASDYIPGLKNIKFLQEDGSQYMGRQTFVEVLQNCAGKTGLGLGLDTYVNLYPTAITPGAAVDPLNETDVNVQTFIENRNRDLPNSTTARNNPRPRNKYPSQTAKSDKPRPMNCYEVIDYAAALWNSRFFQEEARWKFERINYKYLQGTIRRYDPDGTMSGTSSNPEPRLVACNNPDIKLVGTTHSLAMDRVFKRVTVEYKFAFNDAQNNVTQFLRNGDFEDYVPVDQWNYWGGTPGVNPTHVSQGGDNGMWIENFSRKSLYVESWPIQANEGDQFTIDLRVRLRPESTANRTLFALFQVYAKGNFDFNTGSRPRSPYNSGTTAYLCAEESPAQWYGDALWIAIPLTPSQKGQMITRSFSTAPIPGRGELKIRFLGTADLEWGNNGQDDIFPIAISGGEYSDAVTSTFGITEVYDIKIGKVSRPSDETAETSYVSEQEGSFTDEPDIITIINGDDTDPEHISGINIHDSQIPTSLWVVDGQPEYQPDLIGIVVARSVLEQYKQPYHIIEGTIKGPDLKFSDIFLFDMPGVQGELFMVQRGDFNLQRSELQNAVLVQISETEVDSGGTIDGNDTNPNWSRTGWQRCIRDSGGRTTGETEAEEKDFNPYSPTYNQTRWVNIGNIGGCGGDDYYEFLWGASDPALDQGDLINWPFAEGSNQVTVWFSNPGGKYEWFLHRPEAGAVVSVIDNENEEVISDWEYQADVTVDGVLFKSLRMKFNTGTYSSTPTTFVFV